MLFPTHLLGGYLAGRAGNVPVAWAVFASAVPDLVDKPLGAAGVTALYHSVGHSVFGLAAAATVAAVFVGGTDDRLVAVAAGWGSHLALDVGGIALNGRPENVVSLLWPVATKPDPLTLGPLAFFGQYLWSPSFCAELLVWIVGAYVVWRSPAARRYRADGRDGRNRHS